jgi:hypothetical protein
LIGGIAKVFHAVDLGGIAQAADVFLQPEDRRSAGSLITANALEHGAAIAHNMREDVNGSVTPGMKRPLCQIFSVGVSIKKL